MTLLLSMLQTKQVRPVIGKVLPLFRAQESHVLIAARAVEGKLYCK
jgi:hypothetical protein